MLKFKNLSFTIDNQIIKLSGADVFFALDTGFAQIQIAGENKDTHMGAKMVRSSEAKSMRYVSHNVSGNILTIVQESPNVRCETVFEGYNDTNALRVHTIVSNITDAPIVLEEVASLCLTGFGDKNDPDNMFFTDFLQSHHAFCISEFYLRRSWGIP